MDRARCRAVQLVAGVLTVTLASFYAHELGHYPVARLHGYHELELTPVAVRISGVLLEDDAARIALAGPIVFCLLCAVATLPGLVLPW